ncbi:methyltransferase domain-containing protein [Amycolatopsis thermophila]|uniref:Ubiquinone/menaquinone biosynthesis C-methylase UbiE n=1 Tax=Amycolatopsis thermophila TaxID=206084 RepID=A0ABU0F346_9PSEU|nr:methyltransferase domain-containing protein [Amycolatopsis thermophila]MDQ0382010.1 ubiquinone/menaquinone biosynthesis C-methylase UbiE [Amycolatopsis thermophila]
MLIVVALDFMSALSRTLGAMSTHTTDPDSIAGLISVLDAADALPGAAELRARTYELLHIAPGAPIVDVGCGSGRAVAELTERGAECVGVDPSETMLTAARHRRPGLEFVSGTAEELPFPDGVFAGYRADKVFHEVHDAEAALREAMRVLAPGGRIVLLGQDWETFVIDSDHPDLTGALVRSRARSVANPRVARRYRNLLLDQGVTEITVEVHTAVLTDAVMLPVLSGLADHGLQAEAAPPEQITAWLDEQQRRAAAGRLFLAIPFFLAAGTRP